MYHVVPPQNSQEYNFLPVKINETNTKLDKMKRWKVGDLFQQRKSIRKMQYWCKWKSFSLCAIKRRKSEDEQANRCANELLSFLFNTRALYEGD